MLPCSVELEQWTTAIALNNRSISFVLLLECHEGIMNGHLLHLTKLFGNLQSHLLTYSYALVWNQFLRAV